MDSFDRFEVTTLSSQDSFFSKLSGTPCSDSEYTHATRVWNVFGCQTIADYHAIYLQLDVLLLADLFEKFRKSCLDFYNLDPLHYFTTPGIAWDASLRMSRVDLHLISDKDMYHLVENSIRGGIPMISTRHSQANNLHTMLTFRDKISSTWVPTICMVGQCLNRYQLMSFVFSPKRRSLYSC